MVLYSVVGIRQKRSNRKVAKKRTYVKHGRKKVTRASSNKQPGTMGGYGKIIRTNQTKSLVVVRVRGKGKENNNKDGGTSSAAALFSLNFYFAACLPNAMPPSYFYQCTLHPMHKNAAP
jgi:copper oxidase (laccase) domain-containing protein